MYNASTVTRDAGVASPVGVVLRSALAALTVDWGPIRMQRSDGMSQSSYPNSEGLRIVQIDQGERVEIQLPVREGATYEGYHVVNGDRRALPLGSSLDERAGVFFWQPAAGFLGSYDLEFIARHTDGQQALVRANVVVGPSVRMMIDTPQAGSTLPSSFVVAGWAIDLAAADGGGVDAVHVWAYPVGVAGAPIFVGAADYGGIRADVGGVFGDRFVSSGWDLTGRSLAPGVYDLVVFAHSAVSGDFNNTQTVRVTVR